MDVAFAITSSNEPIMYGTRKLLNNFNNLWLYRDNRLSDSSGRLSGGGSITCADYNSSISKLVSIYVHM